MKILTVAFMLLCNYLDTLPKLNHQMFSRWKYALKIFSARIEYDLYSEALEVNLFAFAYRLFHEDFSPLNCDFFNVFMNAQGVRNSCHSCHSVHLQWISMEQ